jgi:hypothetical protein
MPPLIPPPTLPMPVLVIVAAASLVLLCTYLRRFDDLATRLALFAVWLRYIMGAFHPITYPPNFGGLSLNALASCGMIALLLASLNLRLLLLKNLMPIYAVLIVCVVSAVLNGQIGASINTLIKFAYLMALTLALYHAFHRHGVRPIIRGLAIGVFVPVVYQWFSVGLGTGKAGESDGSISFIGGYNHEAAFSVTLLTFLAVMVFFNETTKFRRFVYLAIGMFGLVVANYRTAILAALPPLAIFVSVVIVGSFVRKQRPIVFVGVLAMMALTVPILITVLGERFSDIGVTLDKGASLIKPPVYFTVEEKALFSARAYIWSQYLYEWLTARPKNILVGFGADSWTDRFPLYAHNTFVSYAYEFGLAGLWAILYLFWRNLRVALAISGPMRPICVSAIIGFFVLNLATMPFWLIEGNVLLAIILAHTWHAARVTAAARRVVLARPVQVSPPIGVGARRMS